MKKIPISNIQQGKRHRRDNGDLASLSASIKELGLLHPIGLNSRMELVYGARRLAACIELGWDAIPATILETLDDALAALKAERDENSCREPMRLTEAAALGKELEEIESASAKKRMKSGGKPGPSGNFPEGIQGETKDKVGAALGMSGKTYEKVKGIVEKAIPKLVEAVDAGEVSVSAAAEVAELPKSEQKKLVKAGPDAVKEKASELRKAKKNPEPKSAPDFIGESETADGPKPVIEPPAIRAATEPLATVDEEPPAGPKKAYIVPAVDKDGIPIQEWAVEAFAAVPEFRDLIRLVKDIRKRFSALADTPGGRFLLRRGQWTTLGKNEDGSERGIWRFDAIENALYLLEDTIPQHTDCPYAYNPFAPHYGDECVTCWGLRWTPKQLRSNTAKEIVAALFQHYGVEGQI